MNEAKARSILKLKPKENPKNRMEEFEKVLRRKQGFVDNSPSVETKKRYQKELDEYQSAYDWASDWLAQKKGNGGRWLVVFLLVVSVLVGGLCWKYDQQQKERAQQESIQQKKIRLENQKRIDALKAVGELAISKRKWVEAQIAFEEIQSIDSSAPEAEEGFAAIRQGKLEEKHQKIFYLLGKSQSALEAGNWDEAIRLVQSVLQENPGHKEALLKLKKIKEERRIKELELKVLRVSSALEKGNLPEAQEALLQLKRDAPDHAQIPELSRRLNAAMAELQARQRKAIILFEEAQKLDDGKFSEEALKLLDEAKQLDPVNPDIAALYHKMSSYTRTLEVPAQFDTITKAVLQARPKDRIRVASGVYKESITLDKNVRLEGAGNGKTIIEFPAKEGAILTVLPTASEAHVSGFVLKHVGFDYGTDRASAVIVQGARSVSIVSCSVLHAAGHGIAVIDGAQVAITGCEVNGSGWDGISVYGEASKAEIKTTISQKNLQQGVSFWKGGSGSVYKSRMLANGLCGVLAMSPGMPVKVEICLCARNREAGILISDQAQAELLAVRCDNNLLSGIVVRGQGTSVIMKHCVATGNQEVGILVHKQVNLGAFIKNKATQNRRRQVWLDAEIKNK